MSADNWNFDIESAPRGKTVIQARTINGKAAEVTVFESDRVILATKCGVVTVSRYLPKEDRWEGLATGEQPIAWQWFPELPTQTGAPL